MSEIFTYTDNVNYRGTCYLHLDSIAYVWTRNHNEAFIHIIGCNEPIVIMGDNATRFLSLYEDAATVNKKTLTTNEDRKG